MVALDPNNGEILALASAPTFDPNLFSRIGTKEGRAEYVAVLNDPQKPLINRAVQSRYPPGSTWKVPMAVAGLEQGAITLDHSNLVCGGGIMVGNKFTRCMGNHGTPDLKAAITHSCDGYFYRLGLKMGLDGIMAMVDEFDLNKRTGIDLPNEVLNMTPSRELKKRTQPENSEWKDIDTVYASFGQVYDVITPIALLRTIAGVANGGKLYVPHLLKELKPVGEAGSADYRARRVFQPLDSSRPNPKMLPIPEDIHHLVVEGMWGVVNNGGTGASIRMAGFDIAGQDRNRSGCRSRKRHWKKQRPLVVCLIRPGLQTRDCIGGSNRKLGLRRSARGARQFVACTTFITARLEMQNRRALACCQNSQAGKQNSEETGHADSATAEISDE